MQSIAIVTLKVNRVAKELKNVCFCTIIQFNSVQRTHFFKIFSKMQEILHLLKSLRVHPCNGHILGNGRFFEMSIFRSLAVQFNVWTIYKNQYLFYSITGSSTRQPQHKILQKYFSTTIWPGSICVLWPFLATLLCLYESLLQQQVISDGVILTSLSLKRETYWFCHKNT